MRAVPQETDNHLVREYLCPGCGARCAVGTPERVDEPCSRCAAKATWEALPARTRQAIDEAVPRGAIAAIHAIRQALPTMSLSNAVDLFDYRRATADP